MGGYTLHVHQPYTQEPKHTQQNQQNQPTMTQQQHEMTMVQQQLHPTHNHQCHPILTNHQQPLQTPTAGLVNEHIEQLPVQKERMSMYQPTQSIGQANKPETITITITIETVETNVTINNIYTESNSTATSSIHFPNTYFLDIKYFSILSSLVYF